MAARLTLRDREFEARPGSTVRDAILQAGLQPDSVLAIRKGELITEDEILREGDDIKLVAVISGGSIGAGS